MIKSEHGIVEISGPKPVIVAELITLLVCAKDSLGESDYEFVLERARKHINKCDEEQINKDAKIAVDAFKNFMDAVLENKKEK